MLRHHCLHSTYISIHTYAFCCSAFLLLPQHSPLRLAAVRLRSVRAASFCVNSSRPCGHVVVRVVLRVRYNRSSDNRCIYTCIYKCRMCFAVGRLCYQFYALLLVNPLKFVLFALFMCVCVCVILGHCGAEVFPSAGSFLLVYFMDFYIHTYIRSYICVHWYALTNVEKRVM